jgi:hypothetical protein
LKDCSHVPAIPGVFLQDTMTFSASFLQDPVAGSIVLGGRYSISLMMVNKLKDLKEQEIWKRSKIFYSILSIVNLFVVYLMFGAPDLITLVSAIIAFLRCITSYP